MTVLNLISYASMKIIYETRTDLSKKCFLQNSFVSYEITYTNFTVQKTAWWLLEKSSRTVHRKYISLYCIHVILKQKYGNAHESFQNIGGCSAFCHLKALDVRHVHARCAYTMTPTECTPYLHKHRASRMCPAIPEWVALRSERERLRSSGCYMRGFATKKVARSYVLSILMISSGFASVQMFT